MADLTSYTTTVARNARAASRDIAVLSGQTRTDWLKRTEELIRARGDEVIAANQADLKNAPEFGLTSAATERLRLDESRLDAIAASVGQIAMLPDPLGEIIDSNPRPNGLLVTRVRVPLGVVFFIYEARPNVTVDAAALCVKSGNAVILRGGKEAFHSNQALHGLLADALADVRIPPAAVQLVETTDRQAVGQFLKLQDLIDVTIPRGGKALIERVTAEATMPVIKHFDGVCHVYVDRDADQDMAESIVVNSKCQRPGVCNAAESLLVHADIANEFVTRIAGSLRSQGVELRCCPRCRELLDDVQAATDEDFRTEYLDLIMSVCIVDDLDSAVNHIMEFGSGHTDAIVTNSLRSADEFAQRVDASAVMINASTRFNDGGEFGLGAEIGISTDRFHARGPCGLREMTSYKYVVHGNGQIK